ncbi:hypothetical protein [Streptomyces sp. NPDC091215]
MSVDMEDGSIKGLLVEWMLREERVIAEFAAPQESAKMPAPERI